MAKNTSKTTSSYSAKDIQVLEGLDPVRKRPGMYIGSTGETGLHHLVWEVVDNSLDEVMAGHATTVVISLLKDGKVNVTDNGRGIPIEKHSKTGKSTLETVLTVLHAGGKFGGEGYKISGGLHGVGVSVVNALSSYLRAEVCRDGVQWAQEYTCGEPNGRIEKSRRVPKGFDRHQYYFSARQVYFQRRRIAMENHHQSFATTSVLDARSSYYDL